MDPKSVKEVIARDSRKGYDSAPILNADVVGGKTSEVQAPGDNVYVIFILETGYKVKLLVPKEEVE